jgi:hypothetical protein
VYSAALYLVTAPHYKFIHSKKKKNKIFFGSTMALRIALSLASRGQN